MKILRFFRKGIFHKTAEELREFTQENNIKLLKLLEYLRRSNKKIQKETISNVKNNP
jgi:ferritin